MVNPGRAKRELPTKVVDAPNLPNPKVSDISAVSPTITLEQAQVYRSLIQARAAEEEMARLNVEVTDVMTAYERHVSEIQADRTLNANERQAAVQELNVALNAHPLMMMRQELTAQRRQFYEEAGHAQLVREDARPELRVTRNGVERRNG